MKKEQIFVEERKQAILDYVKAAKKAGVGELCEKFGVSSATIRNDLRDLEQNKMLVRTHGGAIIQGQARFEPDAADKSVQHAEAKKRIARAALGKIEDGDTLIMDTGSTTYELALLLSERKNITVLTNDIAIASCLEDHPSAAVHVIGGFLRKGFHCMVGNSAESMLRSLTVDKAFMAANAFSIERGASTPDLQQAELKRLMISIATKVFFLVDSSKMGHNSFAGFALPDAIDCFVTDSMAEGEK
ncbi:MAG: DeoR/GlpR family DNA-binding transcription regulator, partial [Rectinemataceae bacterium]|nr:DeoR/GlpR family DNA-binding transcription regulator [Rectinemataceae bacterium]